MKRLFISSQISQMEATQELDAAWKHFLQAIPDGTNPRRKTQPHITLHFLGDIDTDQPEQAAAIDQLTNDVKAIARSFGEIDLILGYLHTFPGVLWTSIGGTQEATDTLDHLQRRIEAAADRAQKEGNLPKVRKNFEFFPHITLGKFDTSATEAVQQTIRDAEYPNQITFRVDSIEIMESLKGTDEETVYRPIAVPAMLRE